MSYEFYQCVYDLDGNRLNPTNVWTPVNFWDDACWDRVIPCDCRGLTYLDVGCSDGLYLLRFEQSGGKALGIDVNPKSELKAMYQAKFEMEIGGFLQGKIVSLSRAFENRQFNIVSCMNTLEYIGDLDIAISELFHIAKDRVIICTETSLDKPTWYADWHNARCINLDELKNKIPWRYTYWTLTVPERNHHEIFLVADNPDSSLAPVDPGEILFNLDITETQQNRGILCIS
jgi:SAM-dependent methyltransferase